MMKMISYLGRDGTPQETGWYEDSKEFNERLTWLKYLSLTGYGTQVLCVVRVKEWKK